MSISTEKTSYLQFVSDFLSIVTILICFILKVPQILKLLKVKSAKGLNLVGLLMELTSFFGSGVYFSIAAGLLLGVVPLGLLAFLVPLCTPIGASSKVVQLVEILRTKNAQSVSILTWFISAFTNFTRVFTITMESADLTLLLNFTINTFLSTSVMLAAIAYKDPSKATVDKKSD